MRPDVAARIARLAGDTHSGASSIRDEAVEILGDALSASGADVVDVVRAVCRAQPSMASVWNAGLHALAARADAARFERFKQHTARSGRTLERIATQAFADAPADRPLRLVTLSLSGSVLAVIEALAQTSALSVSCAEGRPALEGRVLASRLAQRGIEVICYGDAALGHALDHCDVVLAGADAVASEWFLNKSGTRPLAAAASYSGIPVYVVATRDKFAGPRLAAALRIREGPPAEIWETPPAGVQVRNPYFEHTPLELVSTVISDAGLLDASLMPQVCAAAEDAAIAASLDELLQL